MIDKLRALPNRLMAWAGSLSAPALAVIGVLIAAFVGAGGYYAYQTYDYVQHDNDFCLSCHLMVDPYERFARSAHRGLGCKACHQPTLMVRSQMALTQIVENPDSLEAHAEVPNERCADCHIDGDPEKWAVVSQSAGHRVHLESNDSTLQGLQCVQCHSSSLHEFAATDKTCAQAGCHERNMIKLGGMADLTIHCAACHGFSTPVPEEGGTEAVLAALAPEEDECMSCHVMRTLVAMPDPDPHGGACAACHNPHTQETPQGAVESCTASGCHTRADTLSPFHRGMGPGVLENCVNCHEAHDFHVETTNCLSCHEGIFRDSLRAPGGAAAAIPGVHPVIGSLQGVNEAVARLAAEAWWLHPEPPSSGTDAGTREAPARPAAAAQEAPARQTTTQQTPRFLHSDHRNVACVNCHDASRSHGGLTITSISDCRSCHHTGRLTTDCSRCHQPPGGTGTPYTLSRTLDFSVSDPVQREMPFDHQDHTGEPCSSCHTEGLALSAASVDCNQCHQQHHILDNDCTSCHREPPVSAHPVTRAHETCGGSGCHTNAPFETLPTTTREVCLVCHQAQEDHMPGQNCAECHALSEPGIGVGRFQP